MSLKKLLLPLLFATTSVGNAADTVTEYLLHTVDSGEGGWPCLFYELNYNTDIAQAERAKWLESWQLRGRKSGSLLAGNLGSPAWGVNLRTSDLCDLGQKHLTSLSHSFLNHQVKILTA